MVHKTKKSESFVSKSIEGWKTLIDKLKPKDDKKINEDEDEQNYPKTLAEKQDI